MALRDLGYHSALEDYRQREKLHSFLVGRVISEHKERYILRGEELHYDAEITGSLRYSAKDRADFPAVGDWVAFSEYENGKAIIHAIFPRRNIIERQEVGSQSAKQIIASNIDFALIALGVDRDFNFNRIERYLAICNASKVKPIIILSKIDLTNEEDLSVLKEKIKARTKQVPVIPISNETLKGIETLKELMKKGKTYCLLGSSGVGKSSLINNLLNEEKMKTRSISSSTNKGRHITSHRELFVLDNGAIIIDNPGMREVGITDSSEGIQKTFTSIAALSDHCKFKDCTHTNEKACAVLLALDNGELDEASYENYLKMEREKNHFESSMAERRQKDKAFGKMIKRFKKTGKFRKS